MQQLYTLGYTGLKRDKLQQWAQDTGALIADIRIRPYSRNATWNTNRLREALGDNYTHIPELGNEHYKGGPTKLVNESAGVAKLGNLLNERPVVLLCVCKDYNQCHRLDVVRAMPDAVQATVIHLSASQINAHGEATQTSFFPTLNEEDSR